MDLEPVELLPLTHSWPLFERGQRFDLGLVHECGGIVATDRKLDARSLATLGIGTWECDLSDDGLTWSAGVYDLFGLPRDATISRAEVVALYAERSRVAMERLRAYAIRHRRGFTLDAEIIPAQGHRRWMRLIAAPVWEDGRPVRLQGWKRDITAHHP
jgi:PAS domain S-box-containing protein